MRTTTLCVLLLALPGCSRATPDAQSAVPPPESKVAAPKTPKPSNRVDEKKEPRKMEITIVETTVADVGELRVGVGNAWDDEYTDASGATKTGPTAMLSVTDADGEKVLRQRVHPNQVLDFGGKRYRVTNVNAPDDGRGSITLTEEP